MEGKWEEVFKRGVGINGGLSDTQQTKSGAVIGEGGGRRWGEKPLTVFD